MEYKIKSQIGSFTSVRTAKVTEVARAVDAARRVTGRVDFSGSGAVDAVRLDENEGVQVCTVYYLHA